MVLNPQNYADFKAIANGLGVSAVVFYYDAGSTFLISAVAGNVGVRLNLSSAKPGSFDSDYPSAIPLAADAAFT